MQLIRLIGKERSLKSQRNPKTRMKMFKKLFIITILLFIPFDLCFAQLSLYAIHSDEGNHQFQVNRIGITSGNILWMIYNSASDTKTRSMYSNDLGQNWSSDAEVFPANHTQPSLYIDVNDSILASAANPGGLNEPLFRVRNGSWPGYENVSDDEPVSYSAILTDSESIPWCVFRYQTGGVYDNISAANRSGGSWQTNVNLQLAGSYEAQSLSACMDPNDNLHAIWRATDPNFGSIQTASFDGTSWSAITSLDTFSVGQGYGGPTLTNVDGTLIALWTRKGVGANNTFNQIRWTTNEGGSSWDSVSNVTDVAQDHLATEIGLGNGTDYYLFYSADEVDPNNSGILNVAYRYYSGGSWSSETALTWEATRHEPTSLVMDGNMAYMIITDKTSNTEECGVFDTTRATVPQLIIMQIQ
jgi:hypothetical protein